MSFGVYRPAMGVAAGMRDCGSSSREVGRFHDGNHARRPPPGGASGIGDCLQPSLIPATGPLNHFTSETGTDRPQKRVDPMKNRSQSLEPGVGCLAPAGAAPRRGTSRLTEGGLGEGFVPRDEPRLQRSSSRGATPERREPGQIVRGGYRPKDHLSSGCIAAERHDHPLNLPRPMGSVPKERGSGGADNLVQGPDGIMPYGVDHEPEVAPQQLGAAPSFQRAYGVGNRR